MRGVRDELLEQLARADESAVQLGRNCRIGRRGGVERAQPPTVVGIELHQAGDHRCDQVFRRTAQDLVEERVLGVREQLGRRLRQPVEVAVEDGARQARPRQGVAMRSRGFSLTAGSRMLAIGESCTHSCAIA